MSHPTIYEECPRCHGDGLYPNPYLDYSGNLVDPETTGPCTECGGTGRIARYMVVDNGEIFRSDQVFEAIDATEYTALSAGNKEILALILSCGYIDLTAGSNAFTLLQNMFGPGTTTRANLLTLIGG